MSEKGKSQERRSDRSILHSMSSLSLAVEQAEQAPVELAPATMLVPGDGGTQFFGAYPEQHLIDRIRLCENVADEDQLCPRPYGWSDQGVYARRRLI